MREVLTAFLKMQMSFDICSLELNFQKILSRVKQPPECPTCLFKWSGKKNTRMLVSWQAVRVIKTKTIQFRVVEG